MKSPILTLIITCLRLVHIECIQFRCDYAYYEDAKGWMKFHEMPTDWYNARLRCRLEGAELASPTADVSAAMQSIVTKNNTSSLGVFTGINALYSSGDFHTLEGIPLFSIPHTWAKGEPDNLSGQENCLAMNRDGEMEDVDCSSRYPYICYKKYEPLVYSECGTVDSDYKLYSSTGSCYKFHREIKSFSAAHMTCIAEGGHLAVINSYTESQVLKIILEQNPAESLPANSPKYGARIGIRLEDGEWRTVQGTTLTQAGYSNFADGEPNNLDGNQLCGAVFRSSGELDDISCTMLYPYVCEKLPGDQLCNRQF